MKKAFIAFLLLLIIATFLLGCGNYGQSEFFGFAYSTNYTNNFYKHKKANQVNQEIEQTYKSYEELFSARIENSDVYKINHSQINTAVEVSKQTLDLLKLSKAIYDNSQGAFNPLMYAITELWGFDDSQSEKRIPQDSQIAEYLPYCSFDYIEIDEQSNTVTRLSDKTMLDFGAIAKGYVMSFAKDICKQNSVEEAAINLGNSIMSCGKKLTIGIRNPRKSQDYCALIFNLYNKAVATSGDYERFFIENDVRYCHILANNGKPVVNSIQSVSVIYEDSTICDILSTTLFVLGIDEGVRFLKEYYSDAVCVFIVSGQISIYCSQQKRQELNFSVMDDSYEVHYLDE